MEERKLSESESLQLIAEMIQKTKSRLEIGDGNVMLLWGYVCVIVGIIVYLSSIITGSIYTMWLWFLIPIIGGLSMMYLKRKFKPSASANSTYVDVISSGIWKVVGCALGICCLLCFIFMFLRFNVWTAMFVFSLGIVGFAAAIQGIVIREKSLIVGGIVSTSSSLLLFCCLICGIQIYIWSIPLFAVCFVLMMIVPGHIINRKAKKQCSKN